MQYTSIIFSIYKLNIYKYIYSSIDCLNFSYVFLAFLQFCSLQFHPLPSSILILLFRLLLSFFCYSALHWLWSVAYQAHMVDGESQLTHIFHAVEIFWLLRCSMIRLNKRADLYTVYTCRVYIYIYIFILPKFTGDLLRHVEV